MSQNSHEFLTVFRSDTFLKPPKKTLKVDSYVKSVTEFSPATLL